MKRLRVKVNDDWYDVRVGDLYQSPVEVEVDGEPMLVEIGEPSDADLPARRSPPPKTELPGLRGVTQGNDRLVRCPLPGKVVSIAVAKGQELDSGDEICLLESMKMEQSVRMAQSGVVKGVKIKRNQTVEAGQPLLELQ